VVMHIKNTNFDPNMMSAGFTPSADPVLRMLSPAYAISFGKIVSNQSIVNSLFILTDTSVYHKVDALQQTTNQIEMVELSPRMPNNPKYLTRTNTDADLNGLCVK
jgi:hypothetical protein